MGEIMSGIRECPQEPATVDPLVMAADLRLTAEYACWDKFDERFTSDPKKHPAWRASDTIEAQHRSLSETTAAKDGAYAERNQCVALIAKFALAHGLPAGIAKTAIEGWDEAWHGCVYIDLPTGQVSWHYHDSDAHLFELLPPYQGKWDGHSTPEKYARVNATRPAHLALQNGPAGLADATPNHPPSRREEG